MKNRYRIYDMFYFAMLILFAFFVCWPIAHYNGPALAEAAFTETYSFSEGWTLTDGTEVDPEKLNKTDGAAPYEEVSICHVLPQYLSEGNALFFRSKNIFFKVFIDGVLVYSPYVAQNAIYTNSYGTNWHYIMLPTDAAGKQLEIRYYRVYDSARACIDNLFLGSPASVILNIWQTKLLSFTNCMLLLFVGLILIIADIPINISFRKNHELRYLGLFSLAISIWCLSETNLIQFFMNDSRTMQIVSCCSLMLIPIPAMLYLDSAFSLRSKWPVPFVCTLSIIEFTGCWLLHFLHIADIHQTLIFSHVMLAISAIFFFATIFRNTIITGRTSSKNIYQILRSIGLCSIAIATIIDLLRYYFGSNGNDTGMFVRIGLLIFIICFGSSSLEKTINAVKLGAKSEIVSQLAYKDGLTQLGNRTAFNEHLDTLEQNKDELAAVGIIIFDVNNLKFVNDHLGHPTGDEMIVKSADAIRTAFADLSGDCYRIGGDEFAVLLSGENAETRYQTGISCFTKILQEHNDQPDRKYRLNIAHGFALYNQTDTGKKTLTDVYEQADSLMYKNKQEIKARQNPREENIEETKKAGK